MLALLRGERTKDLLRRKFSASQFWDDARRFNATTLGYVGELCRYLIDQPVSEQDREHRRF